MSKYIKEEPNLQIMQTIESFDKLYESMNKCDQYIGQFLQSQKNQSSELFKTAVLLYHFFKVDLTTSLQMRQIILKQKQCIRTLESDNATFCTLFSQYTGTAINSLQDAKNIAKNKNQSESTSKELRETKYQLSIEKEKSSKIQEKLDELTHKIKLIEKNSEKSHHELQNSLMCAREENDQLRNNIQELTQQNHDFLNQVCDAIGVQRVNDPNSIIPLLKRYSISNIPSEYSLRNLMVVSIASVKLLRSIQKPAHESQNNQLKKEIMKAQIKLSQLEMW